MKLRALVPVDLDGTLEEMELEIPDDSEVARTIQQGLISGLSIYPKKDQ